MIRIQHWFYRTRRPASGTCRRCGRDLTVCERCDGEWSGRGCSCGIGLECPGCGRYWV